VSRGFGRVQLGCLHAIRQHEANGNILPTTYTIAASVYEVTPDTDGNRWVDDAQHVAVRRALEGLQRKGRVLGVYLNTRDRCHVWMSEKRAQQFVKDTLQEARQTMSMLKSGANSINLAKRVIGKMRSIGMQVV
jgi:hypothetical protein